MEQSETILLSVSQAYHWAYWSQPSYLYIEKRKQDFQCSVNTYMEQDFRNNPAFSIPGLSLRLLASSKLPVQGKRKQDFSENCEY